MIIWLASYPRSGNTLLRMMIKNVFGRQTFSKYDDRFDIGADKLTSDLVGHRMLGAPWPEAYERMRQSPELFFVKTHDAPEDDGKAIYVTRDGRPACVSYFNYLKSFKDADVDLEFCDVIAGFVNYGSWSDHLDAWQPAQRQNTLLLRFEDMLANPAAQLSKLAEFIGLAVTGEWQNDFAKAHRINPKFFRQGSADQAISEVTGDNLQLFWMIHRDWMHRLDYDSGPCDTNGSAHVLRRAIHRRQELAEGAALDLAFHRDQTNKLFEDRNQARLEAAILKEQATSQASEILQWKEQVRLREERIAFLDFQTRQREEWIEGLKTQVNQLNGFLNQLAQDLSAANERQRSTELELDRVRIEWDQASTRADELAEQLQAREEQYKALEQRAQGLQASLDRINNMRWYERIYDTFMRLAKNAMVGWPHGRPKVRRDLPRIAIVTPVYNGESHIRQTIESVLRQNYPNLEYVICDGASTDGTMKIVEEYRDRLTAIVSEKDGGMYDAIAKGFERTSGEIIGYLNADDLYEPGGLLRVGEYFRDHPSAQVVYHEDTVTMDGWRFPNAAQPPFVDRISLIKGHVIFQDGCFFRRSVYNAAGGLDRQMRRAGDWDLWVRLSGQARFRRGAAHVSSFRIRKGQISEDLTTYHAELQVARSRWKQRLKGRPWIASQPRHWAGRAMNLLDRRLRRRPLFYPLPRSGVIYGFRPTPGREPAFLPDQPLCPLTGRWPDRLLFSSRDTRFGDPLINYVYYSSESDLAMTYPPLSKQELNALYEKHYSTPPTQVIPPAEGFASPYRDYFGGTRLDRLLFKKAVLPAWACRKVRWDDATLDELLAGVHLPRRGGDVCFLDLGCFEGKMLDSISSATDWKTYGLEPNANAVAVARGKGHQVFQGFADEAALQIPEGIFFDVIFMGQTIEHLDDPLTVVRRLGTLLKPKGVLVMSTPNLHAKQIELFGPTWSHWHVPYHRYLYSRKALGILGRKCGFRLVRCRSYSHAYWTCLSVQLNKLGVGAAVSHAIPFGPEITTPAQSLTAWSGWLWDWRGKGDYLFAVFKRE